MFAIKEPTGVTVSIPVDASEDYAYFTPDDVRGIREYYDSQGYVVVRGVTPPDLCDRAHAAFEREVKPFDGFIYRQASANPERHHFSDAGYMLNSILNVQSVDPRRFPEFRRLGSEIVTQSRMQKIVQGLFDEPGKVVQTMYFEGNPVTWPHQDTYYLDSERIGAMTACWFAIEDIRPGAGRFFVYPGSHLIDLKKNGGDFDLAFHHDRYKALIKKIISEKGLECRAPALSKGDILLWAAKTIHGSMMTTEPHFSRRSFTAHYIPKSHRFMQYQSRVKGLSVSTINGMEVHHPKDLASGRNRAIMGIETTFPGAYQLAKKLAIKVLTK
jgi:phytanoyl-CoA hydroxylase